MGDVLVREDDAEDDEVDDEERERIEERPEDARGASPCTSPGNRGGRGWRKARGSAGDRRRPSSSRTTLGTHRAGKHSPYTAPLPSTDVSTLAAVAAFPAAALAVWTLLHSPFARRLVAAPTADRWHERATPLFGGVGIFLGLTAGIWIAAAAPHSRSRRSSWDLRRHRDPLRRRSRRRHSRTASRSRSSCSSAQRRGS